MEQKYDNDFTMFGTVRDFMGNHTTETASVPAIATVVAALTGIISQIDAKGTAQATPLTGIATDKDVARTALEEAVFVVSEGLSALAAAANNNTLLDEVTISRPGLDRLSAEDLDTFATRVAERGATNQTALAATYAISAGQVTAITTARTAFAPWVNKPRTAVAERAGQTATIPALVRQGKLLLRGQLDPLMSRYRITDPTLFAAYRTARAIVDRHGAGGGSGGGGGGGGSTAPGVPTALSQHDESGITFIELTLPAGADGFKIYQGAAGPEQVLLSTNTTPPAQLSLGGGPIADLFVTAFNAAGQSAQVPVPLPE